MRKAAPTADRHQEAPKQVANASWCFDDEGAQVGCHAAYGRFDTPHGLILFLVSTYLPIP